MACDVPEELTLINDVPLLAMEYCSGGRSPEGSVDTLMMIVTRTQQSLNPTQYNNLE